MTNGRFSLGKLRWLGAGATIVIVAALAACSDSNNSATAPRARGADDAMSRALAKAAQLAAPIPDATISQSLLRNAPLPNDVVVTRTIPQGGGTIDVPGTDFRLEIPPRAFSGPSMTFTVRAIAGSAIAYDFEPHGTQFQVPLRYVQRLNNTSWGHLPPMPPGFKPDLSGAYFSSSDMVDPTTGIAVVTEVLPADLQITYTRDEVSFPVKHFSGYLISIGRNSFNEQ